MIGLRNSPGTPEGLRHRRRRSPSPPASAPASASDSGTTDSGTGPKPLRGRASLLPLLCLLGLASLLGLTLVAGWGLLAVGCGDLLGTDGEARGRGGGQGIIDGRRHRLCRTRCLQLTGLTHRAAEAALLLLPRRFFSSSSFSSSSYFPLLLPLCPGPSWDEIEADLDRLGDRGGGGGGGDDSGYGGGWSPLGAYLRRRGGREAAKCADLLVERGDSALVRDVARRHLERMRGARMLEEEEEEEEERRGRQQEREEEGEGEGEPAAAEWASAASSPLDVVLTEEEQRQVTAMVAGVRELVGKLEGGGGRTFEERMGAVGWGGPVRKEEDGDGPDGAGPGRPFWDPPREGIADRAAAAGGGGGGGGTMLAAAYLKIMEWPTDGVAHYPYKPCRDGCRTGYAIAHTLEYREKYRPACATPSAVRENRRGWFYVRGHAPSFPERDRFGHTMIYYRPALHKAEDAEAYVRVCIHTLELAVADSMKRSGDRVGRYNLLLDSEGFGLGGIPKLSEAFRLFLMMQDHFADRLGVIVIANTSGPARLFLSLINAFLSESVKKKIHLLPEMERGGREMLSHLIDPRYVPDWLGGTDHYVFDAEAEYAGSMCTEEEGREYLTTMPYHA